MSVEVWNAMVAFEGIYEVSNHGRVRSLDRIVRGRWGPVFYKGQLMSQSPDTSGYLQTALCKDGVEYTRSVHRLVAEAFIPNQDNKPCINHIDEDKTNNHVDNLEWCTYSENTNHGTRNKRVSTKNTNGKCSKEVIQYTLDGKLVKIWPSISETGRHGFNRSHVGRCVRGERKTHKFYKWEFKKQ